MFDPNRFPMLAERQHTEFVQDLAQTTMTVNGRPMSRAVWNMVVSKRDIPNWVERGIKPRRGWRITHCKNYFCLQGSGVRLLRQWERLCKEVDQFLDEMRNA